MTDTDDVSTSSQAGRRARRAPDPPGRPGAVQLPEPDTPLPLRSQDHCGHGALIGASPDRSHVLIVPMMCKSWDCPRCGPRKRRLWIDTLCAGRADREITLTCPAGKFGSPFNAARIMKRAFPKFVAAIRRRYGNFEYACVWELTQRDTPHIHMLVRSAYIPNSFISKLWSKLGIGFITFVQKIQSGKARATHACKYLAKSFGQSARALRPLRIVQVSRHYVTTTPDTDQPSQYPDYSWTWSSREPHEVLEEFLRSPRYFDVDHQHDGATSVFLAPAPLLQPQEQYRQLLTAFPDFDCIPTADRLKDLSPTNAAPLRIERPDRWQHYPSLQPSSASNKNAEPSPSASSSRQAMLQLPVS